MKDLRNSANRTVFEKFSSAEAESSEIPEGSLPSWSRVARKLGVLPETFWPLQAPPPLLEKSALGISSQQPEWATPQITVTARDCRRHRDLLDYQHAYDSMQQYAELLALKYQKVKGNEP
jgi:hypothetical protein